MTNTQKKMYAMAADFGEICDSVGAEYFLTGVQVAQAEKDGVLHGYELNFAMYEDDWEKVEKAALATDRYEIETILDGGKPLGVYYRLIDKNTLLLDLDRYHMFKKFGMVTNVLILRRAHVLMPFLTLFEMGLTDHSAGRRKTVARAALALLRMLLGRERADRFLMWMLHACAARKGDRILWLKELGAKPFFYPGWIWRKKNFVTLGRARFPAVKDTDRYLSIRFGKKWRKRKLEVRTENYRLISSAYLPYAEFMKEALDSGMLTEELAAQVREYVRIYQPVKKMNKREAAGWEKSLFYAGERYRLWKKYMPMKERILSLMAAERYDEAELLLDDYMVVQGKYLKYGITMCFDADLLEAVKTLYALYGKTKALARVEKFLIPEDLEPITADWQVS